MKLGSPAFLGSLALPLLLSGLISNSLCSYIDAVTYIKPKEQFCLSEVTGPDMFVSLTFDFIDKPKGETFSATVREEGANQFILNDDNIQNYVALSFTTVKGTSINFCVTGPPSGGHLSFSLRMGADAKDYFIIAKTTHLKPVDLAVQNVLDELSAFHKAQVIGSSSLDKTAEKAIKTYHTLAKFAIANTVFVVFMTLCYIVYFRHFFKSKKLI